MNEPNKINDGGFAFPRGQDPWGEVSDGMSLRDYFAAKADIPWNAALDTLSIKNPERDGKFSIAELVEQRCGMKYIEADAMLIARQPK